MMVFMKWGRASHLILIIILNKVQKYNDAIVMGFFIVKEKMGDRS